MHACMTGSRIALHNYNRAVEKEMAQGEPKRWNSAPCISTVAECCAAQSYTLQDLKSHALEIPRNSKELLNSCCGWVQAVGLVIVLCYKRRFQTKARNQTGKHMQLRLGISRWSTCRLVSSEVVDVAWIR
jgi:hypothetical protein